MVPIYCLDPLVYWRKVGRVKESEVLTAHWLIQLWNSEETYPSKKNEPTKAFGIDQQPYLRVKKGFSNIFSKYSNTRRHFRCHGVCSTLVKTVIHKTLLRKTSASL